MKRSLKINEIPEKVIKVIHENDIQKGSNSFIVIILWAILLLSLTACSDRRTEKTAQSERDASLGQEDQGTRSSIVLSMTQLSFSSL